MTDEMWEPKAFTKEQMKCIKHNALMLRHQELKHKKCDSIIAHKNRMTGRDLVRIKNGIGYDTKTGKWIRYRLDDTDFVTEIQPLNNIEPIINKDGSKTFLESIDNSSPKWVSTSLIAHREASKQFLQQQNK